jgi:hypothetical protein
MEVLHPAFVDRLAGQCVYCGRTLGTHEGTRDHVPSRCLLDDPLPEALPWVRACAECNGEASLDEEYLSALIGCALVGSTVPELQPTARRERTLRRHPSLRARLEQARAETTDLWGRRDLTWYPEADRVTRVIVKNARGHLAYERGEVMPVETAHVWYAPINSLEEAARTGFEASLGSRDGLDVWPEVGTRALVRVATLSDYMDGWVIVQADSYRYSVDGDGYRVRSVIREYLATEVRWR